MKMRTLQYRAVGALVVLGFVSTAAAQSADEKPFRIRTRTEAFVKAQTVAPDPGDDDLGKLRKVRLNAALKELFGRTLDFTRDGAHVDHLIDASLRLLDAEVDYYQKAEDRIVVLEKHLAISRELTDIMESRTKAEPDSGARLEYARYCQATIRLAVLRAGSRPAR